MLAVFSKLPIDMLARSMKTVSGCLSVPNSISNMHRTFHAGPIYQSPVFKPRDRKELLKTVPKMDEGTVGENYVQVNKVLREDMFVTEDTPNQLINGVPFKLIPVCHVTVTKNNTKILLVDHTAHRIAFRSCGCEGFKNCRKGTNVAAQAVALYISNKATRIGIKDIRLKIKGLGPGRMAAIKGLQLGGMNIVSITDDTRITFIITHRPRKQRRL